MKVIRARPRRADQTLTAAMRLRVNPPHLRDSLLDFLRGSSCLAIKHGADMVETYLLNSVSERHDHAVLIGYVESWKARHVHASVDILSG